jgi:O-antigen/teichoic acid export membrane protein
MPDEAERGSTLLARARSVNPLPEGAVSVAVGLVISGVSTYAFLGVAHRQLNEGDYSALVVLWTAMFAIGNGIMQPLEQEVARAVSDRRARGIGPAPVIRRAAAAGIGFMGIVTVLALLLHNLIIDPWFDGRIALSMALIIGLFSFCAAHLARGVLSSHRRFRAYARFFMVDGISRVVMVSLLFAVGTTAVGFYGMAMAVSAFIGVGLALAGQHGLMEAGPEAPWGEITPKLGWLLLGTGMLSLVVQGGTIAVEMLAPPEQAGAAGEFANGLTTARIPLFLFQAVLASLLPKLSHLAGVGSIDDFVVTLRRLVGLVFGVGVLSIAVAAAFGTTIINKIYGGSTDLTSRDLAMLAAAFIIIMATICLDQALIALQAHSRMALGWLVAFSTFVLVTAAASGSGLYLRVEFGLLSAGTVAFTWMLVCLVLRLRAHAPLTEVTAAEALAEITEAPAP